MYSLQIFDGQHFCYLVVSIIQLIVWERVNLVFIDIHVHTRRIPGPLRQGKQAYSTPEQLITRYDAIGVESAVLLPGVNPECSYVPQSNEEVIEIAAKYPGRFIQLERSLQDFPALRFLAHSQAFWAEMGSLRRVLARDENYAIDFLHEFQDRLFFGTDICAPDTPTPLVDFLVRLKDDGKISAELFEKVSRGNARLLLAL